MDLLLQGFSTTGAAPEHFTSLIKFTIDSPIEAAATQSSITPTKAVCGSCLAPGHFYACGDGSWTFKLHMRMTALPNEPCSPREEIYCVVTSLRANLFKAKPVEWRFKVGKLQAEWSSRNSCSECDMWTTVSSEHCILVTGRNSIEEKSTESHMDRKWVMLKQAEECGSGRLIRSLPRTTITARSSVKCHTKCSPAKGILLLTLRI